MDNNIIVPRKEARKSVRPGRGADYWDNFWKVFNDSEAFSARIRGVKSSLNPILQLDIEEDKTVYAQIALDEKASAKSMQPTELWEHSNLDLVESKDAQTITISGTKVDFKKLDNLLSQSQFKKAKTPGEVSRTEMNLYRECFAMTGLFNKNTDVKSRVDRVLSSLIEGNTERGLIACIIEVYSNQKKTLYDNFYEKILEKVGSGNIKKRDERFFFYNMSYVVSLSLRQIKALLADINFNFIRLIRAAPVFIAERCIPSIDITNTRVLGPETNEVIGIIDSGTNHAIVNASRFQHEKALATGEREDTSHGTFVASRILFGDCIFSQVQTGSVKPCARYLDIQVLHLDASGRTKIKDTDTLQKAIHEAVERYPDVKIYNLSITAETEVEDGRVEELTQFLDHIAREKDITFVCSAGNQHSYMHASNYEEIFTNDGFKTHIASPADALNVITVGSIAKNFTNACFCVTQDFPSPFTRKGGIRGGWKKPELVASGGNKTKDPTGSYDSNSYNLACVNSVGVEGIGDKGLHKDIGTSFSAPLITRQSVYLLDYIHKSNIESLLNLNGNKANLIKALLIQSTAKISQAKIVNSSVKMAYGFGEPNYERILKGDENEVSIVYADSITYGEKVHKVRFKLPDFTAESPVEFIFTLVYNPPVNNNFSEYSMIRLASSLKTIRPIINSETGLPDEKGIYIKPIKWDWDNYKNENFNVIHYKVEKTKLNFPYMEVLTQMSVSSNYESQFKGREVENISQPYTFVLTIRDTSGRNRLRAELMSTNQFNSLIENPIEIQAWNIK